MIEEIVEKLHGSGIVWYVAAPAHQAFNFSIERGPLLGFEFKATAHLIDGFLWLADQAKELYPDSEFAKWWAE